MSKKASKTRRREEPKVTEATQLSVEAGGSAGEHYAAAPAATLTASVQDQAAGIALPAESRTPAASLKLSAEVLAAHDSFVRSPTAVVESLRIRVATAVARKLASTMPPPPLSARAPEGALRPTSEKPAIEA